LGVAIAIAIAIAEHFPSGSVDNQPVASPDIAAAALDLAGLPIDEKADGVSVLGWLHKPGTVAPHEIFF
jgi:arylsulfatase A-like enzyme